MQKEHDTSEAGQLGPDETKEIPCKHEPIQPSSKIGAKGLGLDAAEAAKEKAITKMLCQKIEQAAQSGLISVHTTAEILKSGVKISVLGVAKYTIVELKYGGCVFHGLSCKHKNDKENSTEGVGRALSRATEKLFERFKGRKIRPPCKNLKLPRCTNHEQPSEATLRKKG